MPLSRPGSDSNRQTGQTGSNVIGVLAAGKRSQDHLWSPREIRLLTSIANQLAPAIDNARLYAQVHEGEVGLRTGNQILQEINDMLLEKNANLEGFIQSDLAPALIMASQLLQSLTQDSTTLTDGQRKNVTTLEKIISQLGELTKETSAMSATLDSAFGKVLDSEDKKSDYAGSIKPIRLEKKPDNRSQLMNSGENDNVDSKSMNSKENDDTNSKPMSFEDAIAAGLVPDSIVNREKKQ